MNADRPTDDLIRALRCDSNAWVRRRAAEALVKINSIENQADDIFDMSIERLFVTESDAKEVIKKREIYQVMEIVTDKCEDASNIIESIIIKYA